MKTIKSLLFIGLALASSPMLAHSSDQATDKAQATVPTTDNFSIAAGQSIGKVQIGDSHEKVHQVLGTPSIAGLNGPLGDDWERYDAGINISYRDYKVAVISTTSKKYKTLEGTAVGSSPESIRKLFKGGVLSPSKISLADAHGKITKTLTFYIYTDAKRGIKFQFGNNEKNSTAWCDEITVMRPKP